MSEYSPFQDDENEPDLKNFELGDAVADDPQLKSFLQSLATQTNDDAPKTSRSQTQDLINLVRSPFCSIIKATVKSYQWIQERLTNHNIREATAKRIESEASVNRAKATAIRKEADANVGLKSAQAEAIRTDSLLKLIETLTEKGIDWKAEYDDAGHMHIVFTKQPRLDCEND